MWRCNVRAAMVLGAVVMLAGGAARAQAPGGFMADPQARRQMLLQMAQERLGLSDDEMKVVAPKLEKLLIARRDAGAFGGLMMFSGMARGMPGFADDTPVAKATEDLRRTLDDAGASPASIEDKLKALRQAREKARDEAAKAQKDVQELLTARQEALLVMWGLFD